MPICSIRSAPEPERSLTEARMLREVARVRQRDDEPRRRWFTDERMDLVAWVDGAGAVVAFQLTYDKPAAERALVWRRGRGLEHAAVDGGEDRIAHHKDAPILVPDGTVPWARLAADFRRRARGVDRAVRDAVLAVLTPANGAD